MVLLNYFRRLHMDEEYDDTQNYRCNFLSMPSSQLNHVSKMGPSWLPVTVLLQKNKRKIIKIIYHHIVIHNVKAFSVFRDFYKRWSFSRHYQYVVNDLNTKFYRCQTKQFIAFHWISCLTFKSDICQRNNFIVCFCFVLFWHLGCMNFTIKH